MSNSEYVEAIESRLNEMAGHYRTKIGLGRPSLPTIDEIRIAIYACRGARPLRAAPSRLGQHYRPLVR